MSVVQVSNPSEAVIGLKGDTSIMNATSGWPVAIAELVSRRDGVVFTLREAGLLMPGRPSAYDVALPSQLYRLTTYSGRSIEATADHAFFTHEAEWKALSALGPADAVAVVAEYPGLFGRGDTDAELIKLLAYLTAREAIGDDVAPPFDDAEVRRDFETAVQLKGDRCEALTDDGGVTQLRVHGHFGRGSKVLGYLELVGVLGLDPPKRFVPELVYGLRREKLRLFLNRIFTCDAVIETSGRITYRTKSLPMARQVQHLLARFGVVSLLRGVEPRGVLEAIDLSIGTKSDVLRFIDEIGFLGEKATRAEAVRAALYHVRMIEPPPGRHGHLLFDRVVAIEPTTREPVYSLMFDTHTFIANDFIARSLPQRSPTSERAAVAADVA